MRRLVNILLSIVLVLLIIFTGGLILNIERESNKQVVTSDSFTAEEIDDKKMNLNDDYIIEASADKEVGLVSSDSGQAYPDETITDTKKVDNESETHEETQIKKEEYERNIKKVQETQEKIIAGSLEPDFELNNRGRIDRKQQFKVQEANLTASVDSSIELLDWWTAADKLFVRDIPVVVVDVETGKSYKAIRTYGSNHADVETLTAGDTAVMKEIWGGEWNWERRAVIVLIDGRSLAASASGMPHAGLDSMPEGGTVENRSGDFGTGANLDKIKDNNMEGHFDIHFLNSRTHGTDKVDEKHQEMVQKAFES